MTDYNQMLSSLQTMRELESFLHELLENLTSKKLKHGENVLPHLEQAGLRIPDFLKGTEITWDGGHEFEGEFGDQPPLVLVRPGHPQVLGLTIGCIRIGKRVKVCLECGWFWCRIVIKGTF